MNMIRAAVLGASVLMVGTVASAQAQSPQVPDVSDVTKGTAIPGNPQSNQQQAHPLFSIDGLDVHLWAPVEPPYNPNMNRTVAADPVWDNPQ